MQCVRAFAWIRRLDRPWLRLDHGRGPGRSGLRPPRRSDRGKGHTHTHTHLHGAGREPEVGPAAVRSDCGCDPWAVRPPCPRRSDRGSGRSSAGRGPEVRPACVEGGPWPRPPVRSGLCAPPPPPGRGSRAYCTHHFVRRPRTGGWTGCVEAGPRALSWAVRPPLFPGPWLGGRALAWIRRVDRPWLRLDRRPRARAVRPPPTPADGPGQGTHAHTHAEPAPAENWSLDRMR